VIGLVIVAHGNLAHELVEAAEIIAGKQESVVTVGLRPDDAISELPVRVADAANGLTNVDGVLVLVDLFGGSPCNATMRCLGTGLPYELVSGANLPMLLEVLMQRDCMSMPELITTAIESGRDGIRNLGVLLHQATAQQSSDSACTSTSEGEK
jgi:mannose PTS system EIIA component